MADSLNSSSGNAAATQASSATSPTVSTRAGTLRLREFVGQARLTPELAETGSISQSASNPAAKVPSGSSLGKPARQLASQNTLEPYASQSPGDSGTATYLETATPGLLGQGATDLSSVNAASGGSSGGSVSSAAMSGGSAGAVQSVFGTVLPAGMGAGTGMLAGGVAVAAVSVGGGGGPGVVVMSRGGQGDLPSATDADLPAPVPATAPLPDVQRPPEALTETASSLVPDSPQPSVPLLISSDPGQARGELVEAGSDDDGFVLAGVDETGGKLVVTADGVAQKVTWSLISSPVLSFGTFAIDSDTGAWVYRLNNESETTEALMEGAFAVKQAFEVQAQDENGRTVQETIVVWIQGSNDSPALTSNIVAASGRVIEAGHFDDGKSRPGIAEITGQLSAMDVDRGASLEWSLQVSEKSDFGVFAVDALTGKWTYRLDDSLPATQALKESESWTEKYRVTVTDEFGAKATQVVTIRIDGANDVPVFVSAIEESLGSVTESAGMVQTDDAEVIRGNLQVLDADRDAVLSWRLDVAPDTRYGMFTVDQTGQWTFTLDNTLESTQSLAEGQVVNLSYTVRVTDEKGAFAKRVVKISITGTNDAPVIQSEASGFDITELFLESDSSLSTSGRIVFTDIDTGDFAEAFVVSSRLIATDVTLTLEQRDSLRDAFSVTDARTGQWAFNLDSADYVAADREVLVTYTVRIKDSSGAFVDHDVSISITGTNDGPTIRFPAIAFADGISLIANDADSDDEPFFSIGDAGVRLAGLNKGQESVLLAQAQMNVLQGKLSVSDGSLLADAGLFVGLGTDAGDASIIASGRSALYGFRGNDSLSGDKISITDDFIAGGDGDDVISGGKGGADTMDGGDGIDTLSYADHVSAVAVDLNNADDQSSSAGVALHFENVFGSSFDDTLSGDAKSNELFGGNGNDSLTGGDGNDTLIGGIGADVMSGEVGNDVFGKNNLGKDGESMVASRINSPTIGVRSFQFAKGLDQIFDFRDGDRLDVEGDGQSSLNNTLGTTQTLAAGQVYIAYGQWNEAEQTFTASGVTLGSYDALVVQGSGKTIGQESGYVLLHDVNRLLGNTDFT